MSFRCHQARRSSTAYVDGRLRPSERLLVSEHLKDCPNCAAYYEQLAIIRSALRGLRPPVIPRQLRTNLQIIASRERAAVARTRGSRWDALWEKWSFRLKEMMRPLALPASGGLLSSVLLFGLFILTIGTSTPIVSYEIPLNHGSELEPTLVPVELRSSSVVLNMTVDGTGRIGDYAFEDPTGRFTAGLQGHPASITFPDLPTIFGGVQPISGDIQIRFVPLAFRQ